ncbi:MAG: hypothetical protein ACK5MY_06535 [Jhaorihella sp.]
MADPIRSVPQILVETLAASGVFLLAFFATILIVSPVQHSFFPEFPSRASLLFLPHGVRVLAAWLLGWRAVPALLPGTLIGSAFVYGGDAFGPEQLVSSAIALTVGPVTFHALALVGRDIFPRPDRPPCWACVMAAGVAISILNGVLINAALGSGPVDYFAFLIGDVFGLFFLMLILMFVFRSMRLRDG